jgi:hypothetical protein
MITYSRTPQTPEVVAAIGVKSHSHPKPHVSGHACHLLICLFPTIIFSPL